MVVLFSMPTNSFKNYIGQNYRQLLSNCYRHLTANRKLVDIQYFGDFLRRKRALFLGGSHQLGECALWDRRSVAAHSKVVVGCPVQCLRGGTFAGCFFEVLPLAGSCVGLFDSHSCTTTPRS